MDQLVTGLEKLLKYKNEKNPARFYTYLSDCLLTERDEKYFTESFIPKVHYLCSKGILRKDLVYLSLLASQNHCVLERFLNYDKSVFVLDISDPTSLYDYYIYEKKHWVYEIIDNPNKYDKLKDFKTISNKLKMIKYVKDSNLIEVNIEHLEALSTQIDLQVLDNFWKFYVEEVTRFVEMVKFCKPMLIRDVSDSDMFKFATKNTFLEMLSEYVDLNDSSQWEHILNKLKLGPDNNQVNIFTGFVILGTVIKLLIKDSYSSISQKRDHINATFDYVKTKLIELEDKQLQIELIENIFYLMFHRNRNEFTCREKEIRFVLYLLKSVIEELQLKKVHEKDSDEYRRLSNVGDYVKDALWRLDLVLDTKLSPKVEEQLLHYMLAPPDSLIHFCLKRDNFKRAHQVIEISGLGDSDLAREVRYAEAFLKFKKFLRKNGRSKLRDAVEEFFQTNPPPVSSEMAEKIEKFSEKYEYLNHFRAENEPFMNVFDLALTQAETWEESETLLKLAEEKSCFDDSINSGYADLCGRIAKLANEVGPRDDVSLAEILTDPKYPLDVELYRTKRDFFEKLSQLYDEFQGQIKNDEAGILHRNHPNHRTLLKMNELCVDYVRTTTGKEPIQYMKRIFDYLKAFSRIFYIEQNTSDVISKGKNSSYFDIMNFNRSELTGRLLFERELDPTEFEKYFGKLKLDFLYHVVGNCFPTINLHVPENLTIEELYHDNMLYTPGPSIITYIQKRNWLLAFILNEMYKVEGVKIDISEVRLRTFFNYLKLPRVQHLKALFHKNEIVAALQNCINAKKVKMYFREQIVEHDLVSIHSHNSTNSDNCETGEEILEDTKVTNWKTLHDIIESIPENQLKKKTDLISCKDNVLVNLVQDGFEPDYYKYAYHISERDLRIETIFNNFKRWPGRAACDIIRLETSRFDCILDSKVETLRDWLQHIELNEELKNIFDLKSWYKSYNFCKNYPQCALEKVLSVTNVDFLLDFIELYKPSDEILTNINSQYLIRIMDVSTPLPKIKTLLDSLPFRHTIDICRNLLTVLRNLKYLQFISNYLSNNVSDDTSLRNIQTSLKMLAAFTPQEQEQFFCLIDEPISILEVLLMNTKLDKLAVVLELFNVKQSEVLSVEKVDQLLRKYAEKSLDFRVITQLNPRLVRAPESKLLQSFDSLSLTSDKNQFVVPEVVPTKEEWVQNDEVTECMCCRQVIFSMFNRRHHCRRCGRVVCYYCSLKRMLVPTYGDILVRVCQDCYEQTTSDNSDSSRSCAQEYWLLNDNPEHNKIIREEFSYEHAPSTSLCFSIMKYHSKNSEYPKFLLEQCEVMLKLLQPNQELTYEIDYLLVIRMLKSLATAAKMASSEIASKADRILSQAELLALLAERGCLNLLGSQGLYLDASFLRRLRDKLLQDEQWNLALEVSTKTGLDNTGVFAAWGKSCLKAGSLQLAREKFQRCLDKKSQFDRSSDLNLSLSPRISTSSTFSTSESKPNKDPPLLQEIIQILETKTRTIKPEVLERARSIKISGSTLSLNLMMSCPVHIDTAISVRNRIENLKQIAAGNFTHSAGERSVDPVFYEECVYYLNKYGSHLSLLFFYIRHGDVHTALNYLLENHLSGEIFIEVYMKCLKDGLVNKLQEHMSRIDSSLDLWKNYLKQICRHLEKQQLLNCLYQLQLYIGDYVRASMTCIRFYEENVKSFTELVHKVGYLYKGEEHLKQILEQEQWVEVTPVGQSIASDSFEERMLANPDLVMKIDTKDVNRHINTVKRQIEVVNFLSQYESSGANTREQLQSLSLLRDDKIVAEPKIPTLFGSTSDKITLAAMAITGGGTVEDGFKLATRIVDDFKLRPIKVYCLAGKQLARSGRYGTISQLVGCIKAAGADDDAAVSDVLDEMLAQAVRTLMRENAAGTKVEDLIKLIKDKAVKISAYIEARQLKTAYFLAVKYRRTADIRRIQREAELLNMPTIKALCQRVLQSPPHAPKPHSKGSL